jgi:CDP-glucose 4,6-dehydratase
MLKELNSSLKPDVRNEASHEIRHQYLSAEKARRDLSWKPLFTLPEGLSRTIAWYRSHLSDGR